MINPSTPVIDHISAKLVFEKFDFDDSTIKKLGEDLCRVINLNIVATAEHNFHPIGYTIVFILAESHLAIHTWPENNLLHIDLVSCRKINKSQFDDFLNQYIKNNQIVEYTSESHYV